MCLDPLDYTPPSNVPTRVLAAELERARLWTPWTPDSNELRRIEQTDQAQRSRARSARIATDGADYVQWCEEQDIDADDTDAAEEGE